MCPGCGELLVVPQATIPSAPSPEPEPEADEAREEARFQAQAEARLAAAREEARFRAQAEERYKHILADKPERTWRDYSYWLLLLALVPLVFSLMGKEDLEERF